jgi:hypothetical protein
MYQVVTADSPVSDEVKNHPQTRLCEGGCNRWTRTGRMRLADFPNTVVRGNETHCQLCMNRNRRVAGELLQKPNVAEDRLAHTLKGLQSFMADRRARGISADGLGLPHRVRASR